MVTGPDIQVTKQSPSPPHATGGPIVDGIYDLVALLEFLQPKSAPLYYRRSALRFSNNAALADQTFEVGDSGPIYRKLALRRDPDSLSIAITCPDNQPSSDDWLGFTAQGTELRIFQPRVVEVYSLRR